MLSEALLTGLTVAVVITVALLVWAFTARRMPDLRPWHRWVPRHEFRARAVDGDFGLTDYLDVEDRTFAAVQTALSRQPRGGEPLPLGRYEPEGRNNPSTFPHDWNRTFEMRPGEVRGGVLLLHGLTDSPYSMRRIGEILRDNGFYALGLRLPGHGTFPAAISESSREDWIAATRIGAAHVCREIGRDRPFWIAGYSNGAALALGYAIDAVDEPDLRRPDRLVLFSPAIGVTRFAALAWWHRPLSVVPFFEKLRWHTVYPEHDPFKYNSFPNNAGFQTHRLLAELRASLDRVVAGGRSDRLPPVLTFQSLADATVLTEAVVEGLYVKLPDNGSELVIFDINRVAYMAGFIATDPAARLDQLQQTARLDFRLTVLTNATPHSRSARGAQLASRLGPLLRPRSGHPVAARGLLPVPRVAAVPTGRPDLRRRSDRVAAVGRAPRQHRAPRRAPAAPGPNRTLHEAQAQPVLWVCGAATRGVGAGGD